LKGLQQISGGIVYRRNTGKLATLIVVSSHASLASAAPEILARPVALRFS